MNTKILTTSLQKILAILTIVAFIAIIVFYLSTSITEANDPQECIPPQTLTTTNITSTTATLDWNAVGSAFGYQIKGKKIGSPVVRTINVPVSMTDYSVSGLRSDTTYKWSVSIACNSDSTIFSNFAPPATFTTNI